MKKTILVVLNFVGFSASWAQTAQFTQPMIQTFQSPNGVQEKCWSPRKWKINDSFVTSFSQEDLDDEQKLCGYDFYRNMGICPKLNSTNPGVLVSKIPQGMSRSTFQNQHCGDNDSAQSVQAKFKQSITCSYTASGIAAYHVSRLLGGIGRVPVAVLRTMDADEHRRIVDSAINILESQAEPDSIIQSWNQFAEKHESRPSSLFNQNGQLYGFLADNVKNEFKYTEVSGVGGYDERYQRFIVQPPYQRVASEDDLSSLAGSRENSKLIPIAVQMKDVSDMVLLDTLLSQDDRIGNIHFKFKWYYIENGEVKTQKSKAEKVERRNQSQVNYNVGIVQAVVPAAELSEMKAKKAFLVKEMILKDNDCGVNVNQRSNNMRSIDGIENVRHMSPKTYVRFMKFAKAVFNNQAAAQDYFTRDLYYSAADFKGSRISFMGNLQRAQSVLLANCQSGVLQLDLDVKALALGQQVQRVSCEQ